jgi:hypothetical protein
MSYQDYDEEYDEEEEFKWQQSQEKIEWNLKRSEIEEQAIDYKMELEDLRQYNLPNVFDFVVWYAKKYHNFNILDQRYL